MQARTVLVGMMVMAALLPVAIPAARLPSIQALAHDEMPWPAGFDGRVLQRLPLSPGDQRFSDRFPGQIGRFTDGERIIIMRAVDEPTQMLHSAAVCFRGLGYRVESPQAVKDGQGITWGCFTAKREDGSFSVCERKRSSSMWSMISRRL